MSKAEQESLMSLLVGDHHDSTATGIHHTMFSATTNLHSSSQPLLPLSLFADNYCNPRLTNITTTATPPKPQPQLFRHHHHPSPYGDYYSIFNHLPDLLSLDHSPAAAEYKRARLLDSSSSAPPPQTPVVAPPRGSRLARKRRQSLSDKMRCLQKLLPWEKKMDTATMLEAAHAYIRFLHAQVAALHSMPVVASDASASLPVLTCGGVTDEDAEVLARLSRCQMLQVVAASPVAQMRMADLGRCVVSVEQMALMNEMSAIRSAMASASASAHAAASGQYFMDLLPQPPSD